MKNRINIEPIHYIKKRANIIRIAICDDEQSSRNTLRSILSNYSRTHSLDFEISDFSCSEDLLCTIPNYEIVFLDYKMREIDGLTAAKELRQKNSRVKIIFVTGFPDFVNEAFEVKTFRFFKKPITAKKIHEALDDYLKIYGNNSPLVFEKKQSVTINIEDIEYIEARNKKCCIHIQNEEFYCSASMSKIFSLMPKKCFFKVNNAYVVNFNNICKYNGNSIFFISGNSAPLSRKYRDSFKKAYLGFARDIAR